MYYHHIIFRVVKIKTTVHVSPKYSIKLSMWSLKIGWSFNVGGLSPFLRPTWNFWSDAKGRKLANCHSIINHSPFQQNEWQTLHYCTFEVIFRWQFAAVLILLHHICDKRANMAKNLYYKLLHSRIQWRRWWEIFFQYVIGMTSHF